MTGPLTLEALDLAALLCSRVCHDLISPVGAVVNGLVKRIADVKLINVSDPPSIREALRALRARVGP